MGPRHSRGSADLSQTRFESQDVPEVERKVEGDVFFSPRRFKWKCQNGILGCCCWRFCCLCFCWLRSTLLVTLVFLLASLHSHVALAICNQAFVQAAHIVFVVHSSKVTICRITVLVCSSQFYPCSLEKKLHGITHIQQLWNIDPLLTPLMTPLILPFTCPRNLFITSRRRAARVGVMGWDWFHKGDVPLISLPP